MAAAAGSARLLLRWMTTPLLRTAVGAPPAVTLRQPLVPSAAAGLLAVAGSQVWQLLLVTAAMRLLVASKLQPPVTLQPQAVVASQPQARGRPCRVLLPLSLRMT